MSGRAAPGETVVRRSGRGWVVGDEEASDLTSAMVLADLLAADLASSGPAAQGPAAQGPAASTTESTTTGGARAGASAADTPADGGSAPPVPKAVPRHARPMNEAGEADEAARLAVTVSQLEHALQAAHCATEAGADEEVVLAALLHDVGHLVAPAGTPSMGWRPNASVLTFCRAAAPRPQRPAPAAPPFTDCWRSRAIG